MCVCMYVLVCMCVCLCRHMYVCTCVSTIDWESFVIKKVMWDKSSMHFNFVEAEIYSMYEYTKSYITKNFREFNFVKHWPIQSLFT